MAPTGATIDGIHHVTAIAGDPQRNLEFYAGLLGLRLVKLTVNYDDPFTYHFYYGDGVGSPGTILTFFPMPKRAAQGRRGTGQVSATAFAIPAGRDRVLAHAGSPARGSSSSHHPPASVSRCCLSPTPTGCASS